MNVFFQGEIEDKKNNKKRSQFGVPLTIDLGFDLEKNKIVKITLKRYLVLASLQFDVLIDKI